MDVYYIMIFVKILIEHISMDRIFHDRLCQIILWWQLNEPHCSAWLCYYAPSDDYGISTCNSNNVTRSAEGLSQAAIL